MISEKKDNKLNTTIYPEDKDWFNYKTDLNDGWADDVTLECDLKKDLEYVKIDENEPSASPESNPLKSANAANNSENISSTNYQGNDSRTNLQENDNSTNLQENSNLQASAHENNDNKKVHPFRLFMICWIGGILIVMAILLDAFLNYLIDYQNTYEESLSYHDVCNLVLDFRNGNYSHIYNYLSVKPDLTEFESQETIENYIDELIKGTNISYTEASSSNSECNHYYIYANDFIVADVEYRKDPNNFRKYKFPIWYISSFEFYMEPQHNIMIEVPDNYTVYLNNIPVSDEYLTVENMTLEAQSYYKDYTKLPTKKRLSVSGLYMEPEIVVLDSQSEPVDVYFNQQTGIYSVSLGSYLKDQDSAKQYAISFISDYTNYISGDFPRAELNNYFIPESDMFELINAGTFGRFFNSHIGTEIKNAKVTDFIVYNNDAVFCRVSLTQVIQFNASSSVDNKVNLGVYLLRTDDGWKVCTIQY